MKFGFYRLRAWSSRGLGSAPCSQQGGPGSSEGPALCAVALRSGLDEQQEGLACEPGCRKSLCLLFSHLRPAPQAWTHFACELFDLECSQLHSGPGRKELLMFVKNTREKGFIHRNIISSSQQHSSILTC